MHGAVSRSDAPRKTFDLANVTSSRKLGVVVVGATVALAYGLVGGASATSTVGTSIVSCS